MVSRSGLVTITGGKWTTYRRMGAEVVEHAARVAGLEPRPPATETLVLHGGLFNGQRDDPELSVYGGDADTVARVLNEQPGWNELLHPRLPYRVGEIVWAARHEHARAPSRTCSPDALAPFSLMREPVSIAPNGSPASSPKFSVATRPGVRTRPGDTLRSRNRTS